MKDNFINETSDVALTSINFGLTFATALAWNEFFKNALQNFISGKKGLRYQLIYAIAITILTSMVLIVSKMLTAKELKQLPEV